MKFIKSTVCASLILAITACGDNESAQTYISKAESQIVEKQDSAAIISLKNALKLDAKNAQARFLLGKLYLNMGDAENAIKEFERANKFKFSVDQVLPLLARAYMLAEDDEAILALAPQEKLLSNPNTQYLAYKVMAALRTDNKALAQETVEAALSVTQSDGYSMLAKAYLAFFEQKLDLANTSVGRILVATPDNVDALMLQGQIATAQNNYELAVESFSQYLKFQPNSGRAQIFLADSLVKNGQFDEAENIADSILAKVPNQPFLLYIKALVRFEKKDYKAASSIANQSLSSGFKNFRLKLVAGASAFYLQNYEQSNHHLKELLPYLAPEHPARRMLAISQLQLGLIDDISETLTDYDSTSKENAQFLSTLSYELLEVGAFEKAKEMANYAAASNGMTAEQTARAGVLKLLMNDPSGIDTLELAVQQNPELISAELALAFASIKSGDLVRATAISDKWLKEYPNNPGGYNLKATIFFKENKLAEGKAALEKSLEIEPNNVYALTQLVKLANHEKDKDLAVSLTEQALKAHPETIEVLGLYFEFHKDKDGLDVITQAQQNHAKDIKYGILLAQSLMQLEQFKQASSVLDGYDVNVKTPKRYWQLLLSANAQQADGKDLLLLLEQWHKTNAYHIEPVFLLANYWANKKAPDKALNILNDAFKNHPKNVMLHLVKMQLLLNNNDSKNAKLLFTAVEKFDLNKDLLAGIEGRILLLDKEYAAAIPKLKQQYQSQPNNINASYLAFALEANSQKGEAIKLLELHADKDRVDNKINPKMTLSLANMYLADDKNKAIAEYERLIKAVPNNVVALNNLSWLYMDQGKTTQAVAYAKQAYELAPKVPNVVDTYGQALLKSNKKGAAVQKAKEAYDLSEGKDIDIVLNFAEALLANNMNKEAQEILNEVTAVTKEQKDKKQRLLKSM
jgi:putative PEP-CTERM system TPR-repeat lipoprotein